MLCGIHYPKPKFTYVSSIKTFLETPQILMIANKGPLKIFPLPM
jgi:hypothetical protein